MRLHLFLYFSPILAARPKNHPGHRGGEGCSLPQEQRPKPERRLDEGGPTGQWVGGGAVGACYLVVSDCSVFDFLFHVVIADIPDSFLGLSKQNKTRKKARTRESPVGLLD